MIVVRASRGALKKSGTTITNGRLRSGAPRGTRPDRLAVPRDAQLSRKKRTTTHQRHSRVSIASATSISRKVVLKVAPLEDEIGVPRKLERAHVLDATMIYLAVVPRSIWSVLFCLRRDVKNS